MQIPSDVRSPAQAPSTADFDAREPASLVAALTDEEICPLCLGGYAPIDEAICAICDAPACPSCVEQLDMSTRADGAAARCFACRPALVPPPALPGAAARVQRDPRLPPPLPRQARGPQPPPLPAWALHGDGAEPDEGGLVVFPAWRKRPLLALARAADAVHLVEVSSLLVGWAHTGGRRFALSARVSRVSREWTLALRTRAAVLRARSIALGRHGLRLSLPLWTGLRIRGAALSRALKVRALVLAARTSQLSRQVPRAARAAWSHLPGAPALRSRKPRGANAAS